jgi:Na+/pantothenate symporter
MYRFLLIVAVALFPMIQAQIPKVSSGKIERISDFKSQFVTPRNIDVWLPENYSTSKNMLFCICRMDKCFTILISRGTNNLECG